MNKNNFELLAPAGNFLSAFYAFSGGADAVYLGLKAFSARKSAANFSIDELRSLKTIALESQKKIFVTMNTILKEPEVDAFAETVLTLDGIADAIILQDLGALNITRKLLPKTELHASTQMAVHNSAGVKIALELGFKRVVLSRELTFDEIKNIRQKFSDIELEVFVHGALCYSFSGLCLASGILLDRSGNRGECAQICRSFYTDDLGKNKGCYFSCNDIALYENILKLRDIGVKSFKIEGRMKSPEYVYNVSQLYANILQSESVADAMKKNSEISFSRRRTTGFFNMTTGESLISKTYPGHLGTILGYVEKSEKNSFVIKLLEDAGIRDGLMFFENGDEFKPVRFGIEKIFAMNGRELRFAKKGEKVTINSPQRATATNPVYHISSRILDLKEVSPKSFKEYKVPVNIEISLFRNEIVIEVNLWGSVFEFKSEILVDEAKNQSDFKAILKNLFYQSGDSLSVCGEINFLNKTGFSDDRLFVQPRVLKEIKNKFYLSLEEFRVIQLKQKVAALMSNIDSKNNVLSEGSSKTKERSELNPFNADAKKHGKIPFAGEDDFKNFSNLANIDNVVFVPLKPVVKDREPYFSLLEKMVQTHSDIKFCIGINNISHLEFAKKLTDKFDNVSFFIDFYLFVANRFTVELLSEMLGQKLQFIYWWIEDSGENMIKSQYPIYSVGKTFIPPLFYSLGCFYKHSMCGDCKMCSKNNSFIIENSGRQFEVIVKDCVTYLFLTN